MRRTIILAVLLAPTSPCLAGEAVPATPRTEPATFSEVDLNQDGRISRDETSPFAALELVFDGADANKDGLLDMEEFRRVEDSAR